MGAEVIHHGDLFDVLPTLPEASVDACVTDPPYGIGFMGREWDTFKPENVRTAAAMKQRKNPEQLANLKNVYGRKRSPAQSPSQVAYDYTVEGLRQFQAWTEQWAREVHRVLKPGAYLVVCGAPRSYHRMACGLEDAGFVIRDKFSWLFGQGFPKNYNLGDGKGTALKPAHEPIALAWKPFKGSIKGCHAEHGTAALNIDACRIEGEPRSTGTISPHAVSGVHGVYGADNRTDRQQRYDADKSDGRWPSNVLLDEEAAAMLDEQTGELQSGFMAAGTEREGIGYHGGLGCHVRNDTLGDRGGASRFYYIAKPSREERDLGGERNIHPTVKPVELMRWLVKLVTPIGGTVLDPFTGSGTTGMACAYELRTFIGIEREAEYVAIAERRISACVPLFTDGERTA